MFRRIFTNYCGRIYTLDGIVKKKKTEILSWYSFAFDHAAKYRNAFKLNPNDRASWTFPDCGDDKRDVYHLYYVLIVRSWMRKDDHFSPISAPLITFSDLMSSVVKKPRPLLKRLFVTSLLYKTAHPNCTFGPNVFLSKLSY